ncbi:hypothetical protein HDU77_005011 [Chytriomyces hyalinus]|nr:hypothetical protein HDU77_005011 [Chytriomyces hyalinus]
METRNKASSTLLGLIRKDTAYADVHLVFKDGAVLTAHAVVLASTSDYYKEALSEKWTSKAVKVFEVVEDEEDSPEAHISKKRQLSRKSSSKKITLNHPNVNMETAKIVLDYMYLGDVEIPPSLASSVIVFANEIMVFGLVQKCADILVKGENLSVQNALAFYFLCDRIHAIEDRKSIGLGKMLLNLPLSLKSGRDVLSQMSGRDIETMILFKSFEPLHRWRILIAWCKASLETEGDLALESGLPEDFQIEVASKLIEPLLPVVELFKLSAASSSLVVPFQALLSESMQSMLEFHLKGKTRSGGNQWATACKSPMDSLRAIQPNLPVCLKSFVASDPVLLLHEEPGTYTEKSVHTARDGKPNTLTLIKLKTGTIFGGYSAAAWTNQSRLICPSSFSFLIASTGAFLRLPFWSDGAGILGGPRIQDTYAYGLNYGFDRSNDVLSVKDHVLIGRMSQHIFSGFCDGGCAFIKQMSAAGYAHGAIEFYEVYRIR